MTREEIALQLTLKNFDYGTAISDYDESNNHEDTGNIYLAKAVATFFNTVYEHLLEE